MSPPPSPYADLPPEQWPVRTRQLIDAHPLKAPELVDVVLSSWQAIFSSRIGPKGFSIGADILPKPQIMGFFLHELIPLELKTRYPTLWSPERTAQDKDLVYLPDDRFSVEIKTSSNATQVFGNRSYAQPGGVSKKSKSGYFLAVNFEAFGSSGTPPQIRKIRFGWLDDTDWIGQPAATGQQARIDRISAAAKLVTLYPA